MRLVFFQRKPRAHGNYSLELIFSELRERLPRDLDIEVAKSPYESNGLLPRLLNCLRARKQQGDVNHITGDVHYLSLALKKTKTILTIHDCVTVDRLNGFSRWLYVLLFFKLAARQAQVITVVSEATKNAVLSLVDKQADEVVVIHNALTKGYRYTEKVFSVDKPRLLHIGLAQNKNFGRLVQSIKGLNCHLRVIAKLGQKELALLEQYDIEYSCAYNISQNQMREEYENADIVCFVSTQEGFGMPIIEAQAIGRAVLTSNCSSMPEVAGDAAELVDPFNTGSIRAGLKKLINDHEHRHKLIERGQRNIKRFDPQKITDQYTALYRRVFENSNATE